jgi:acyl carrier protein
VATTSSGPFERAIVRRLSQLLDASLDASAVDCHASFFEPTGYFFGGHVLDSLDIVEMIVALEVDFGISIVETYDATRFDSIAKLGVLLEGVAGESTRVSFEQTWGPDA